MTRRKRLCLLLAALTLLLALSACGAQSKLVLATTGMEPTLDLTLPDTITLPDQGRDTVYKTYVDKAYSMALAAALLDMDTDAMQTQLAGRLSYDAQTGYIQYYTPTEELTPGDLSEFPTDAQLEQTVRERLKKFEPELADTSRIVFSSATYETNVSSKTVDVTPEVNGRMVYGQYHISISFDRDGNVTALTQQYAPLKMGGTGLSVWRTPRPYRHGWTRTTSRQISRRSSPTARSPGLSRRITGTPGLMPRATMRSIRSMSCVGRARQRTAVCRISKCSCPRSPEDAFDEMTRAPQSFLRGALCWPVCAFSRPAATAGRCRARTPRTPCARRCRCPAP